MEFIGKTIKFMATCVLNLSVVGYIAAGMFLGEKIGAHTETWPGLTRLVISIREIKE